MKKRMTRLLAMLLCVLSIAALLPTTALAANVKADEVKKAVTEAANTIKSFGEAKLQANGRTKLKETVKVRAGITVKMYDPLYNKWGPAGFSVKYQWFVKKKGSSKWTKIKGATKYYYRLKATKSKNGYQYRCKVINKRDSSDYIFYVWKLKVTS